MKLQKQNVIYRTTDLDKIAELKAKGYKEVKAKSKLAEDLNKDKNPDNADNK